MRDAGMASWPDAWRSLSWRYPYKVLKDLNICPGAIKVAAAAGKAAAATVEARGGRGRVVAVAGSRRTSKRCSSGDRTRSSR
ncbi:protein of unknown function [Hyphomicrobium sp. 1Nfss2.1]